MPLDPSKLEDVKPTADGGFIARCPVCAQDGGDSRGVHLRQFPTGEYGCVAHQKDKEHSGAIYALAGDKSATRALPATPRAFKIIRRLESRVLTDPGRQSAAVRSRLWTPEQIRAESPAPIPAEPFDQAFAIVRLFRPRDVVWIGDHYDSGKEKHARHFRTASAWLKGGVILGPRICPAAFVPGVITRAQRTVYRWRFLVVESDTLPKPEQGAILRWLRGCHMRLRAVIDTGGRSLHGWFDLPPKRELEVLRSILPKAYGTDAALFNPAQPCRLPGWPREDTGQLPSLIYLDP